jgi:hypothetical protein
MADQKLSQKFWMAPPNNCTEREANIQIELYRSRNDIPEPQVVDKVALDHQAQNRSEA